MVCHAHKPRDFSLRVGKKTKNRSALDRFVGRTLDLGGSEKRETGFGPATFSLATGLGNFCRQKVIRGRFRPSHNAVLSAHDSQYAGRRCPNW